MRPVMDADGIYWRVLRGENRGVTVRFRSTPTTDGRLKATVSVGGDAVQLDVEMTVDDAVELGETLKTLASQWGNA
jgi:hypothetical protein